MNIRDFTQQNRVAWNEIAVPRRGKSCPPEFFLDGKRTITPEIVELLGGVEGKRVLNLQCANGEDAISFALMGADVTAVDISDVAVGIAQEIAAGCGAELRFVQSDLYDLPADLQQQDFDIVWTRIGITCWLPDLDEWASIIARALRPGGRFFIEDMHPVGLLFHYVDGGVEVAGDYFGRSTASPATDLGVIGCGADSREVNYQFSWPLGDIITSLARAGLRIESVVEFPLGEPYYYAKQRPDVRLPELVSRLPGSYRLVATKSG